MCTSPTTLCLVRQSKVGTVSPVCVVWVCVCVEGEAIELVSVVSWSTMMKRTHTLFNSKIVLKGKLRTRCLHVSATGIKQ